MASQRVLLGGGRMTWEEVGGGVRFYATRPMDGRGLYKVWICGNGGRILLGTMIPEGNTLQLRRTVSRSTLLSAGCYPVTGGEVVMAFPFQKNGQKPTENRIPQGWKMAHHMENRLFDDILKKEVEGKIFFFQEVEGGFLLAAPYHEKNEIPLLPLFCFVNLKKIEGLTYLLWKFDEEGRPIVWNNS